CTHVNLCLCATLIISLFFCGTVPTVIYTLSLHDALPIYPGLAQQRVRMRVAVVPDHDARRERDDIVSVVPLLALCLPRIAVGRRSEEHTSELQSRVDLVCRLLLEKKNTIEKIFDR